MDRSRADLLQTLAWLAGGVGMLWLLALLSPILTPFILAGVLSYICNPLVERLVRLGVPRTLGVLVLILLIGAILALLILILAPLVYSEAQIMITRLPDLVDLINTRLAPKLKSEFGIALQLDVSTLRKLVTNNWSTAQDWLSNLLDHARVGGMAVLGWLLNLILVPVVMFYLLQSWPSLLRHIDAAIPRPMHAKVRSLVDEVDRVLSQFLRGELLVMLLLAAYYSIGLWIAGINFALPVGVLTGLLVFIPFVGYGLGLTLALLTAALQFEGVQPLIGVAVVYGIGQVIESYVLTPYLVGERIGLHPLAVIFALLAFGQLFGFTGMLIALPVSAMLLVGLRELRQIYLASHFYHGNGNQN
ncbi:MAG: AI-2E family transporter [Zoogloea sp.]|nr:AI-2E family transporter [Zoogloea sp.]